MRGQNTQGANLLPDVEKNAERKRQMIKYAEDHTTKGHNVKMAKKLKMVKPTMPNQKEMI